MASAVDVDDVRAELVDAMNAWAASNGRDDVAARVVLEAVRRACRSLPPARRRDAGNPALLYEPDEAVAYVMAGLVAKPAVTARWASALSSAQRPVEYLARCIDRHLNSGVDGVDGPFVPNDAPGKKRVPAPALDTLTVPGGAESPVRGHGQPWDRPPAVDVAGVAVFARVERALRSVGHDDRRFSMWLSTVLARDDTRVGEHAARTLTGARRVVRPETTRGIDDLATRYAIALTDDERTRAGLLTQVAASSVGRATLMRYVLLLHVERGTIAGAGNTHARDGLLADLNREPTAWMPTLGSAMLDAGFNVGDFELVLAYADAGTKAARRAPAHIQAITIAINIDPTPLRDPAWYVDNAALWRRRCALAPHAMTPATVPAVAPIRAPIRAPAAPTPAPLPAARATAYQLDLDLLIA